MYHGYGLKIGMGLNQNKRNGPLRRGNEWLKNCP